MEEIINRNEELNGSSSDSNYNVDEDDYEVRICEEINIEPEVEPDEHRRNYNDGDRNNDNIDHVNDHNDDELLYNGAEITVQQSMLLILAVQLNHNVTQSCIADIIELINLHCPRNDIQRNSLYKFNKFFNAGETGITKYFYCTICTRALETSLDICPTCTRKKPSYFVRLPLQSQLYEMYQRNNFYEKLRWRNRRPRNPAYVMTDIYDGAL